MINDLREFLNLLEAKKDLVHISRPTSPRFEIAAGIRKTSDIEGPAVLFDNVVGHSMPVVGGLYAVRRRAIWGLKTIPDKIRSKVNGRSQEPYPATSGERWSLQEVILTGEEREGFFKRISQK